MHVILKSPNTPTFCQGFWLGLWLGTQNTMKCWTWSLSWPQSCIYLLYRHFARPCFSKSPFGDHDTPRRTKCPDCQTMSQRLRQPKQMPWASQVPCSHSCPARSWGGESGCRQSSIQLSHNPIAGGLATSIGSCIELLANSLQKLSRNVILVTFYATVMANIYSIA